MKILAIETSCDETGVAIVEGRKDGELFTFEVLGSALLSQAALHAEFGGVYPNLAKREHEKNLPVILRQALENAAPKLSEKKSSDPRILGGGQTVFSKSFASAFGAANTIDAIAVTAGPGLEPALWTGIEFAKKLALEQGLPLLPTNHMEGHLISSLVQNGRLENVQLPVLALLISGGHTEFVFMRDWFNYQIIGETLDDAVGEAFDKVARMLGLPYPGGPEISKIAQKSREASQKPVDANAASCQGEREQAFVKPLSLPRPMLQSKNCDLSFSGLKTAALYALRDMGGADKLSSDEKAAFAAEFEDAVGDVFVAKTRRALEETGAKTFVIGGGVAANRYLRERLQQLVLDEFSDVELRLPELAITGDNAVMIAEAALLHLLAGDWQLEQKDFQEIRAVGSLSLQS